MKVLASDFDNTLFTEDYDENIKKINEFVNKGNIFIIATGRNLGLLKPEIESKNLNYDYLICNDGGINFDKNFNILYRLDIEEEIIDDLVLELKNDPNITVAYIDDGINHLTHKTVNNNVIIARYINPKQAQETLDKLMEKYSNIQGYLSHNWINIVNKKANKGNAIKYLKEKLNLNKQNIYTVGDNINDISMNEMYNGYYMKNNSKPELIEVSKAAVNSVKELINLIEAEKNDI